MEHELHTWCVCVTQVPEMHPATIAHMVALHIYPAAWPQALSVGVMKATFIFQSSAL